MIFIYKIRTVVFVLYMYTIPETVKNRAGDAKIPCPIVLHAYSREYKPKHSAYSRSDNTPDHLAPHLSVASL